ncbi:septum site-determining protein MinC [Allohahella sp. A8]|uniref:septum site-determining protein MinC n=1 Tax=Allohahella sp. A8 TaxID=3141461 RepID=UPI000C0ACC28|nr:septum site-determining protein MinC [Hahellaceae bacterium]
MSQANADLLDATCLQIRGALTPLTTFELYYYDEARFLEAVEEKIAQAPKLFENLPIVLSLEKFEGNGPEDEALPVSEAAALDSLDFGLIKRQCAGLRLQLVAVRGARGVVAKNAKAAGLAVMTSQRSLAEATRIPAPEADTENEDKRLQPVFRPQTNESIVAPQLAPETEDRETAVEPAEPKAEPAEVAVPTNRIVTTPVRSGQQIYAKGGDLIVTAPVSAGAELLADGNIHVYGALRGRALAGVKGNQSARIFCHSLEAELVSIAGQYRISEDLQKTEWQKSCQIYLADGKMKIQALN